MINDTKINLINVAVVKVRLKLVNKKLKRLSDLLIYLILRHE
jgi:hypothetical protein